MPGFTATSLYPEAAGIAGIPMPDLCDRLARPRSRAAHTTEAPLPLPK